MKKVKSIHSIKSCRIRRNYRILSDAACKELLGDKLILACILKTCVVEFYESSVQDIETKYIEGEPEIGTIGVHPETTNSKASNRPGRIHGIHSESTSDTEGKVMFDIRFYALTPDQERVKLIINVEAQNRYRPGYPLIKRAIYYGCRQISAQYGSEFEKADYGSIKKVYSIWICFAPPKAWRNTITSYRIVEEPILGNVHEAETLYDLMRIVMICLGTPKDERYTGLVRLLDVFTSNEADLHLKMEALKSEFEADMPLRLQRREVKMCNYSDYIAHKSRKEGRKEGLKKGMDEGLKLGKADSLIHLMQRMELTLEEAMEMLSIPSSEWNEYRGIVEQLHVQSSN